MLLALVPTDEIDPLPQAISFFSLTQISHERAKTLMSQSQPVAAILVNDPIKIQASEIQSLRSTVDKLKLSLLHISEMTRYSHRKSETNYSMKTNSLRNVKIDNMVEKPPSLFQPMTSERPRFKSDVSYSNSRQIAKNVDFPHLFKKSLGAKITITSSPGSHRVRTKDKEYSR